MNVTKNTFFVLSRAPTDHGFNFNCWFLYELKQDSSHKFLWDFPFLILSYFLVYILLNKKYGLFDFKEASTKDCETVKKYKSVMKIFFHVILNKVLNWHFCK